jgi:hypothetical protein
MRGAGFNDMSSFCLTLKPSLDPFRKRQIFYSDSLGGGGGLSYRPELKQGKKAEGPEFDQKTKKAPPRRGLWSSKLVRPAGFEPATYGFEVRRSIQLSYGRIC